MKKAILPFLFVLISFHSGISQKDSLYFSVGTFLRGSYAGWNAGLFARGEINGFAPYFGPSFNLNRGQAGKTPIGFNAGLDYFIPSKISWLRFYPGLDYQLIFFTGNKPADYLQEIHLCLGLQFEIRKKIFLGSQLGTGAYFQSVFSPTLQKRLSADGYNTLVAIIAGVHL